MQKLNHTQVKKATIRFWLVFAALLVMAFLPVYSFFKSYAFQQDFIRREVDHYKQVLNTQQQLKQKTDSLFNLMSLLNTGKVESDVFLQQYIADHKTGIEVLAETDSTAFGTYRLLMRHAAQMLRQKDTLIAITGNEQLMRNNLLECLGKVRKVKQELAFDPARNFSSRN